MKQLLETRDTCQVSHWSSPVWCEACLPHCYIVNSHPFLNCCFLLTWMVCLERHVLFCAWVPLPLQWFSHLFTWFSILQCLLTHSTMYNGCLCASSAICRHQCAIHTFKQTNKKRTFFFFSNQVILVSRYIVSSSIYRMPWKSGERKVDPKEIC